MASPRLTNEERAQLAPLLDEVRSRLESLANGDASLLFAYRRRLWNQLQYDERLKPPYRASLKRKKRIEQNGLCNVCHEVLPVKGAILDRHDAPLGYNMENTQLLCPACDAKKQRDLNYK